MPTPLPCLPLAVAVASHLFNLNPNRVSFNSYRRSLCHWLAIDPLLSQCTWLYNGRIFLSFFLSLSLSLFLCILLSSLSHTQLTNLHAPAEFQSHFYFPSVLMNEQRGLFITFFFLPSSPTGCQSFLSLKYVTLGH